MLKRFVNIKTSYSHLSPPKSYFPETFQSFSSLLAFGHRADMSISPCRRDLLKFLKFPLSIPNYSVVCFHNYFLGISIEYLKIVLLWRRRVFEALLFFLHLQSKFRINLHQNQSFRDVNEGSNCDVCLSVYIYLSLSVSCTYYQASKASWRP